MNKLPILCIREFETKPDIFVASLKRALSTVGFFYLRHGLPNELCTKILSLSRQFFLNKTLQEKRLIDYHKSPQFRGYMEDGMENTGGKIDHREQIEFGPEKGAIKMKSSDDLFLRLVGPNQFPASPPEFKSCVMEFAAETAKVCQKMNRALALCLDLPESHFDFHFTDPHWQMKTVFYPKIDIDNGSMGVNPHSDSGFLSLVLSDAPGLQAQNFCSQNPNQYEWVDVDPVDGCFAVNVGEMFEICSKSVFPATPHRVVPPTTEEGRVSVPFFWNPNLRADLSAFSPNIRSEREFYPNRITGKYGDNALKSLARSHREVLRCHHPDLQVLEDGSVVSMLSSNRL